MTPDAPAACLFLSPTSEGLEVCRLGSLLSATRETVHKIQIKDRTKFKLTKFKQKGEQDLNDESMKTVHG